MTLSMRRKAAAALLGFATVGALGAAAAPAGASVPTSATAQQPPSSPRTLDAATKARIQEQCPPGNVCFWETRYFGGAFRAYPDPWAGGICEATPIRAGSVYNRDDQTWNFYKAPGDDCSNEALKFSLAPEQWKNGVELMDPVTAWN
ncbi:peptidase inhibitor family I36 protein [Streptomyces sp. HNM0574]|uniref:peptidase inhibitor family I36 protein n=1 Tax=Streptomyces sp. HNM0574 TaxID=2714954 RepID=UPI00146A7B2A|nr:peptidase inhibitor family I36 protein [Streptomyces sp. HNM0574]NLU70519.1 hypothetical protein [Streptomyces sp. HNM0574]